MTIPRILLARAERLVTPTSRHEAELTGTAERVLAKVRAAATSYEEVRDVIMGGSFAKGTWLPGDVDLDIFVKIAPTVPDARFEFVGLSVGREAARGYPHGKKYAQHPYTEALMDGVRVNIVPCYDVKRGEWKSAADRSPYHVEFVTKHMDRTKKTQVRLLKRFMSAVGVYGAEIENEGFSGYAAEVLVHEHESFEKVLAYFSTLRPSGDRLLTLMDPIDEQRDLSKAMSRESIAAMMLASRDFLDSPTLAYFGRVKTRARPGLTGRLYAVRFEHRKLSEDTLWGELKKTTKQLVNYLERLGFTIARASACSNDEDRSAIILLPEVERLSDLVERTGPGAELASEVKRFVTKNREKAELVWAGEDARIHIVQKREDVELSAVLGDIGSRMSRIGGSKEVARSIRKNGRVLHGPALRAEVSEEDWFKEGVERIVSDSIGTR